MKKQTKMIITGLVILALVAILGGKLYMENQEKNLEKQRTAAIGFKEVQPGIEEIKFMQSGSYSGAGIWSVGVRAIVNGKEYKEILNKDGLDGGEPLPDGNTGTDTPVKVIYSTGKEEIIK